MWGARIVSFMYCEMIILITFIALCHNWILWMPIECIAKMYKKGSGGKLQAQTLMTCHYSTEITFYINRYHCVFAQLFSHFAAQYKLFTGFLTLQT